MNLAVRQIDRDNWKELNEFRAHDLDTKSFKKRFRFNIRDIGTSFIDRPLFLQFFGYNLEEYLYFYNQKDSERRFDRDNQIEKYKTSLHFHFVDTCHRALTMNKNDITQSRFVHFRE